MKFIFQFKKYSLNEVIYKLRVSVFYPLLIFIIQTYE